MKKRFVFFILTVIFINVILFSNQKINLKTCLKNFISFSYDSLLFGKIPSIFIEKGNYSKEKSFIYLKENLKKNKDNLFFLLEDLNLILRIETLNFEAPNAKILDKLKSFYKKKNIFIYYYLRIIESALKNNYEQLNKLIVSAYNIENISNEQKLVLGMIEHFFISNDKKLIDILEKKSMLSDKNYFNNYVYGKISLFLLKKEPVTTFFWESLFVNKSKKLYGNIFDLIKKNIEKYKGANPFKSYSLEKFYLEVCLMNEPDNPVWMNNLGYFLSTKGKTLKNIEMGLKYCQKAVKMAPNNPYFLDSLGLVLSLIGKYEESEKIFKRAIKLKPDFYDSIYNLSSVYYKQGRISFALNYLNKAIKADPSKAVAKNDLGYILIDEDIDYTKGIDYVNQAVSIEPGNPFFLDSLGWGYYKVGDYKNAEKNFLKNYSKKKLFDNLIHLSYTYFAQSKYEKALKILTENYSNWPNFKKIPSFIGKIDLINDLNKKIMSNVKPLKLRYYKILIGNIYSGMKLYFKAYSILKTVFSEFTEKTAVKKLKKIISIKIMQKYFKGYKYFPLKYYGRIPLLTTLYTFMNAFEPESAKILNFDTLLKLEKKGEFLNYFIDIYKTRSTGNFVFAVHFPETKKIKLLIPFFENSEYLKTIRYKENYLLNVFGYFNLQFFPAKSKLLIGSNAENFKKLYNNNYYVSGIIENLIYFNKKFLLNIPINFIKNNFATDFYKYLQYIHLVKFEKQDKRLCAEFKFKFIENKVNKIEYNKRLLLKQKSYSKLFSNEVQFMNNFNEGKALGHTTVNAHILKIYFKPEVFNTKNLKKIKKEEPLMNKIISEVKNRLFY